MGLVAWYKFEDDVTDSTDNEYDGTVIGSPTYVNGKIGKSIDMDGQNDYINVSSHGMIMEAGKSFAVWINASQIGSAGHSYYPALFGISGGSYNDFVTLANNNGAIPVTSGTVDTLSLIHI